MVHRLGSQVESHGWRGWRKWEKNNIEETVTKTFSKMNEGY